MSGDSSGGGRRHRRAWAVDVVLIGLALLFVGIVAGEQLNAEDPPPMWLFRLDLVTGLLGCLALWLRRRWPVPLAVALIAASFFSEAAGVAMLVALFTVAMNERPRITAMMLGGSVSSNVAYSLMRPHPDLSLRNSIALGVAILSAVVGWGLFVRYRRQLKEDAARRERLEIERARHRARDEIARELHDVLGHRLSLLSLHAGALEFRPDAPESDLAEAAGVVREQARLAMRDLREVLGVLSSSMGELSRPSLSELVADCGPGMRVELVENLDADVPERLGRTVYRIVQEALTNARKHAPGAAALVRVGGAPGGELAVEVSNGPAEREAEPDEEPGYGLIGLAERAKLVGGRLEYGPSADGGWAVRARLPWSA